MTATFCLTLADRGLLACYDARTGKQHYRKERLTEGRAFTASPWAYNGLVFCANEYGETFVVRAGPKFELVQTNLLGEDDMVMASPAITDGRVFLRTDRRLYCLEQLELTDSQPPVVAERRQER